MGIVESECIAAAYTKCKIYEWASIKISFAQAMMIDVCYIAVGMITVTAVLLFLFTRISKKGLGFGVGFSVTVLPMAVALVQAGD